MATVNLPSVGTKKAEILAHEHPESTLLSPSRVTLSCCCVHRTHQPTTTSRVKFVLYTNINVNTNIHIILPIETPPLNPQNGHLYTPCNRLVLFTFTPYTS